MQAVKQQAFPYPKILLFSDDSGLSEEICSE